jgi:plasmid stability protein
MGDNNISDKLRALAAGTNRSATARLREIYDEIEAALRSGVRRKDVHQLLTESGFQISFASFELALYRIRKKKEIEGVVEQTKQVKKAELKSKPVVVVKNTVANVVLVNGKEVGVNADGELMRPPGYTNANWLDLQMQHDAAKKKLKLNRTGD